MKRIRTKYPEEKINKPFVVYRLYCRENNKSYIGIAQNIGRRISSHWAAAKRGEKTVLYNTVRKYGKESFIFFKIDSADSWEEACELEKQHINRFNTKIPNGMNMTNGGDGILGLVHSDKSKRKTGKKMLSWHQFNIGAIATKLTKQDVIEIRKRFKLGGISQPQLAKEYGVGHAHIGHIISGKRWKNVPEGILTFSEIHQISKDLRQSYHLRYNKGKLIHT
jgi:predicted GIY-YIG superfamily endonuclease